MNGIEFLGKPTVVASATHNGARNKPNEDRYDAFIAPGSGGQPAQFLTVADGVTSSHGGERASDIAVRVLKQSLSAASPQPLRQRMVAAIVAANREILDTARQDTELRGMSTTLVLAAIDGGQLHVMFLGDSRAYLLRNGKAHALTRDHTWVQEAVDEGRITAEQARTHPNKHVIQRYLGDTRPLNIGQAIVDPEQPESDPDKTEVSGGDQRFTTALALRAGDAVLLCSDGLYNRINDQEIGAAVTGATPERAVKWLIDTAVKRQEADNITIVLWTSAERKALAVGPLLRKPAFAIAAASALLVLAIFFLLWQMSGSTAALPESTPAVAADTPTSVAVADAPVAPPITSDTEMPVPDSAPAVAEPTHTATIDAVPVLTGTEEITPTATVTSTVQAISVTSTPLTIGETPTITATVSLPEEMDAVATAMVDSISPTDTTALTATLELATTPTTSVVSTRAALAAPTSSAPTSTRIPAATPTPTATTTPTLTPTRTPRPSTPATTTPTDTRSTPVAVSREGGPQSVTLLSPADQTNSSASLEFKWKADTDLLADQVYELVFWRPGETINAGKSPTDASKNTAVTTNPGALWGTGDYRWSVWLGRVDQAGNYQRIRPLHAGIAFTAPQDSQNDTAEPGVGRKTPIP